MAPRAKKCSCYIDFDFEFGAIEYLYSMSGGTMDLESHLKTCSWISRKDIEKILANFSSESATSYIILYFVTYF